MESAGVPVIDISTSGAQMTVAVSGDLTIANTTRLQLEFDGLAADRDAIVDMSDVTRFDTSAAWVIASFEARLKGQGRHLTVVGAKDGHASLLRTVTDAMPDVVTPDAARLSLTDWVAGIGEAVAGGVKTLTELIAMFGLFLSRLVRSIFRPRDFRGTALFHHCEEVGVKAVPIVALMAFLIGIVLAFQGSTQLKQFGAEVFVVDLIAVSILRELGILLTSIVVAGRTASAFTAAIGSMKMREEIDAMYSLGLDPANTLFVPRILALVIMLPILGLVANVMGLLGGGLMAWIDLGISPAMFTTRLVNGTDISHVIAGMIKAPVFALIIGVIGCHAGMKVQSNAESLGRMTSRAVVAAIFAVIMADALFSIFFAQIGF